jgi:ABC-2 type transport system ATP-binding protein
MPDAIETVDLTKDYGAGRGLFALNLSVAKGEAFGYLGPNGAGKTTTIRLLMDMIRPTRGGASIFGLDCRQHATEVKHLVGYLPGELPQFGGLRGSEVVTYLGGIRGGLDRRLVADIAERFDLDLGRRFREYSRGNKQKLAIVLALMHRPQLLILDEPTAGLDPLNQQAFYELVREARQDGATVFLSSHVLSEVEHVCDRVGIIRAGRLVQATGLDELHRVRVHRVEVEFDGEPPPGLEQVTGVEDVRVDGNRVTCTVRGGFEPFMKAISGAGVASLVSHEPSLEDVFLAYYRDAAALPAPR